MKLLKQQKRKQSNRTPLNS